MTRLLIRGLCRLTAGLLAILFVYGVTFAMEGMTTRIPTSAIREVVLTTLWFVPIALVFSSGADDIASAAKSNWFFWLIVSAGLALVYYYEFYTTDRRVTHIVTPIAAFLISAIPHCFPRIKVAYSIFSFAAGICGLFVMCWIGRTFMSGSRFATTATAFCFIAFALASLSAAVLSFRVPWPRTGRNRA
jgi:hypothetical protein